MPRDVVRTSFSLCEEMHKKLRGKLNPHLIAIPSLRIRLNFEDAENHEMDFDYDYNYATGILHMQNHLFSCDIDAEVDEHGEIYADIRNKHWYVSGAKEWFYDKVVNEKGMLNWMGLYSQFMIVQNYIAKYGLLESFDVEEKVAKKPANTHRSGKRKKNEVRLYRCYTLKKDWKKQKRLKTVYVCPAWNVRGHYRHNKNGSVTFVHPYVKGKERNKLIEAPGKEYKLIPGKERNNNGNRKPNSRSAGDCDGIVEGDPEI